MASCLSGWSELPKELLTDIASCLENHIDVLHLRAVCNHWRKSVPVPPKFPVLPINFNFLDHHPAKPYSSYVLSNTTVYRIQPGFETYSNNRTWFIKLEETNEYNKVRVLNPFSKYPIKNVPVFLPKDINHLNFKVVETARAFSIRKINDDGESDFNGSNTYIRKIKLASNFDSSYVAAAITGGKLGTMRVDNDIQWSVLHSAAQYRDIANFEGKFFTVDIQGGISGFEENSFKLEEQHSPLGEMVDWKAERYFVESSGHLYFVVRDFYMFPYEVYYDEIIDGFVKDVGAEHYYVPANFRVFKRISTPDHEPIMYKWVEVNDLGDQVFFVSNDCSFSFSARDSGHGCHGNCIIYVDEVEKMQHIYGEDINVEDNNNRGLKQLRYNNVGLFNLGDRSSGPLDIFPQYLAMFWPPPRWLKSSSSS